jgi:hypothetical protein
MRSARARGTIGAMQLENKEFSLSIDPGSDPIAGRIGRAGGSQTRFEGYVQLVAALEDLRGFAGAADRLDRRAEPEDDREPERGEAR